MTCYEEGRAARREKKARTDCPYPADSHAARCWCEGWTDSDTMLRALGES